MIYTFENLPTYNFFKASETGDVNFLCTEGENVDISLLEGFVNEYNEITNNSDSKTDLSDKATLIVLRAQYVVLNNTIRILSECDDQYHIDYIIGLGYAYDKENKIDSLDILNNNLKVIEKKLGIKQTEYITKHKVMETVKFDFFKLVSFVSVQLKMDLNIYTLPIKLFAYHINNIQSWQTAK